MPRPDHSVKVDPIVGAHPGTLEALLGEALKKGDRITATRIVGVFASRQAAAEANADRYRLLVETYEPRLVQEVEGVM